VFVYAIAHGLCPDGEVWGCIIPCSQLCSNFEYKLKQDGYCLDSDDCCINQYTLQCGPESLWRDKLTCVESRDCMCVTPSGKLVKPGIPVNETDCEVCQCINNQIECDDSDCKKILTTQEILPTRSTTLKYVKTTGVTVITTGVPVTPPPLCSPERFIYLIELTEPRFKFSSRQHNLPNGIWKPQHNVNEYLQVDLGQQEPIYGSVVWGSHKTDEYVTSYNVLYSNDGKSFSYVLDARGENAIFRGPADPKSKVEQYFHKPVEARYMKWIPLTWHKHIAMKVELIGCKEIPTTYEFTTTSVTPFFTQTTQLEICQDAMGLQTGILSDQQISASSVLNNDIHKFGPSQARLNNAGSWVPKPTTFDQNLTINFDFLEPRNLTGVITQGDVNLDSWIIKFAIQYSHDGAVWNPILETGQKTKKIFVANFDASTPFTTTFERIIHARYLRLIPIMWHKQIALRAEIIGCFLPYPTVTYPTTEQTFTPSIPMRCTPCEGWQNDGSIDEETCHCPLGKLWDGKKCVHPRECPCYEGYTSYSVGSHFDTNDCERCICKMGGQKICEKKKCEPCEEGAQWVLTPRCGCVCKPCPYGTVLCQTSNICINETSWCDGVEDCPDDEISCPTPTTCRTLKTSIMFSTSSILGLCPEMKCPSGFTVLKTCPSAPGPSRKEPLTFKGRFIGVPSARLTTKGGIKTPTRKLQNTTLSNCPKFCCVPEIECGKEECPPGFDIEFTGKINANGCREIKCLGTAVCNVTGSSFNTFDGTDFQFRICNHILARDLENNMWDISMYETCPDTGEACSYHIAIIHNEFEIYLHPDRTIDFNGQSYNSAELLKRIGLQLKKAFTVSNIGGYVLFKSTQYGFQLIWNRQQDLKIAIPNRYVEQVDGLCGFFNHRWNDDKMKPDGKVARTTEEFGNSWVNPYLDAKCRPAVCSPEQFKKAQLMCSHVRESLFFQCKNSVDIERYISQCTESACTCLQNKNATQASCQCDSLLNFVKQCSAADSSADLSSWRIKYNCPAICEAPFVYHDCYQRQCEPSCSDMKSGTQCPVLRGNCFSGCFCPEGLVRHADNCVKPEECRDCTCDGFGDPQYMTFDYTNYTFNGNCTYVASRDKNPNGKHTYEVLVTNVQCQDEPISTCTKSVIIKYGNHSILLTRKQPVKHTKQQQNIKE
ncbi:hypothetical protein L9F63_012432, partial [Diploptera punctata]